MTTQKDNSYDFGNWIARQNFDNRRRAVVIQMPDGKRYVSRITIKGLLEGWWRRRSGQTFVCHIRRMNKFKEVTENYMRRTVVAGNEMDTSFTGFDRGVGSNFSGDVYEVDAIKRDGDTVIVRLAKRLQKSKTPYDFTLKEWKPKTADAKRNCETQRTVSEEKGTTSMAKKNKSQSTPKEIVAHLDTVVVGQADAKRRLAVGVTNHYKRIREMDHDSSGEGDLADVKIEKSNILLLGPTGCGKTFLLKSLAEKLDVPFAISDATTLTEAGYVGEDVETILLRLLIAADYDVETAQRGIVYIDEIDKLRKSSGNVSITRDVSGEGVQQSLLKMVEGKVCHVPAQGGRKHPDAPTIEIDTTNILFVCGGAFVGLDEKRSEKAVTPHDLVQYGMIPEFIGRFPVIVGMEELGLEDLMAILTEPRDALLKQYRKLCRIDNVDLEFTDDAVAEIAKRASQLKTGARGLRSVVESFMSDFLFESSELESGCYQINASVVRGTARPKIVATSTRRSTKVRAR